MQEDLSIVSADDGRVEQPHPESAEALMRLQPLNPYEKLEFSPLSFREATRDSYLCV